MASTVVVDFNGSLSWLRPRALAYRDLSEAGDAKQAARRLFATLRWTESLASASRVFVAAVTGRRPTAGDGNGNGGGKECDEHAASVADRVFRAASGRVVAVRRGALPPAAVGAATVLTGGAGSS